jgi:hypothetical protein
MVKYQSEAMNLIRSSNSKIEVPPHVHEYIFVQMLLERVCRLGRKVVQQLQTLSSLRWPENFRLI